MIRKQVYLEPGQDRYLRKRSAELGITQAELIRRCIDQSLNVPFRQSKDLGAWEEAKKLIKERMEMDVPQSEYIWNRDELYDERLERYSR